MKKRPYNEVRYAELRDISPLAIAVKCFDGSEAVLPKSQVRDLFTKDALLVPCWLVEKTGLQAKEKKVWLIEEHSE